VKKLVLFGAGKIGRSFVAQLFSTSGYEIVFVDIQAKIIDALNNRRSYSVIIKAEKDLVIEVKNVRGVLLSENRKVTDELIGSDLIAVSVGQSGLRGAMEAIAEGLIARYNSDPSLKTDIILAENLRNAAEYFTEELYSFLPMNYPLKELVGLVETSIGKMVPLIRDDEVLSDPLLVYAEAYNTLIIDRKAFKNQLPEVKGLSFKDNMKAWVDRKSFIHNLGHAATAYLGFLHNPSLQFTWEVLDIPKLHEEVRGTMIQSAHVLHHKYPDEFTMNELEDHIDDLLLRFRNRNLGDTIYRLGCDLFRKLGPADRLSGVIRLGLAQGLPVDRILYVLIAGIYFKAKDENGNLLGADELFHKRYNHKLEPILREVCGFDEEIFGILYKSARDFNLQILGLA
jgi:mannitol-1-phosphate 5-dehydrogenase